MILYIIRHGETPYNEEQRMQGQTDVPLNEFGRELARQTAEGLKDVPFDLALTSPLSRAVETAELVIGGHNIPIITDQRLIEFGMGIWENHLIADLVEMTGEELFNSYRNDTMHFQGAPGGESGAELLKRAKDFWEDIIQRPEYQDKTILISSHGGTIRAILHNIYDDKNDFWHGRVPFNCSVNIVSVENGKAVLLEDDKIYYDPANAKQSAVTL